MTLTSLDEVVYVDFEFLTEPGERPEPICMVALEHKSGRMFRVWLGRDRPPAPPFAMGPEVLVIAYFATAELSCFCRLGWPFPHLVVDLYAEFRIATNGLTLPHGSGLLGALQWFGLNGIAATKKGFVSQECN